MIMLIGIVISCVNAADTVKMKQLIDGNIGNEYDTILPEIKKPRAKILKINANMTNDEILYDIRNKNEGLHDATLQTKKVFRNENNNTQDVVVEVDGKSFIIPRISRKVDLILYSRFHRVSIGTNLCSPVCKWAREMRK